MDFFETAREGGWHFLGDETIPDISSSSHPAYIFANAPAGTRRVYITWTGADIYFRFGDNDPETSAPIRGHVMYAATGNSGVNFLDDEANLRKIKAIQSGGTPTGWITYYK